MKGLQNIVVGIDYSEDSQAALREAARIALWEGAGLTVVHVFDTRIYDDLNQFSEYQSSEVLDRSHRYLNEWVEGVIGRRDNIETMFTVGHPLEELLRTVDRHSADLLVLGAHGLDHGTRKKVGTLASRCTRKSSADVLLVRARDEDPFHKIITCVDFSENSIKAARHAIHVAQMDLASLEFLHIYQPVSQYIAACPDYIFGAANLTPAHDEQLVEELQEKLESLSAELVEEAGGCEFSARVVQGFDLRGAIIDHVNETGADLVIVGARGKSTFRKMLLGTTAEKIISHATCSTLAVKPDGFDYATG